MVISLPPVRRRLRPARARLEIALQQFHGGRTSETDPEETVHGALLNLRSCFPAGDRRLAYAQQVRELLLGQPQLLPPLANLLRRQQTGRASKRRADLLIRLVVDA